MNEVKYPVLLRTATPSTMTLSKHNKSNWIDTLRSIRHCRIRIRIRIEHIFILLCRIVVVAGSGVNVSNILTRVCEYVSLFFSVFFFLFNKIYYISESKYFWHPHTHSSVAHLHSQMHYYSTFCRQQFRFLSFTPSAIELPAKKILFQHNFDFDFHMAAATTAAANKT